LLVLPLQQVPVPLFRSGVDVVEVEATVTDTEGDTVSDLVASDFSLVVDRRARPILSATYVSGRRQQNAAAARSIQPLSDTGSFGGRLVVFVIDEGNLSPGSARRVADAASRALDRLDPDDRVALTVIPSGTTLNFSATREQIRSALARVVGRWSGSHGYYSIDLAELFAFDVGSTMDDRLVQRSVVDRECPTRRSSSCEEELRAEAEQRVQDLRTRTQATIAALTTLLQELGTVRGPKTLVLMSEGLAMKPGGRESSTIASLAAVAAAARVTIDSVLVDSDTIDVTQARAPSSVGRDQGVLEASLMDMSSLSGGSVFRAVGQADSAFDRLGRGIAGHYVVTFLVLPEDRDGKVHQIRLTSVRERLSVHARAQFAVKPDTADVDVRLLRDVLRSPFQADTLALRVATYTIRDTDPAHVRLLVSLDLPEAPPTAHKVSLVYQLTTGDKVVGGDGRSVTLERTQRGAVRPVSWLAFRGLVPGAYGLQLSASVGVDRLGSVRRMVDARLHKVGSVAASDLLLAEEASTASGPFAVPAELVVVGDQLVAGVELYAQSADEAAGLWARFEVTAADSDAVLAVAKGVLSPSGAPLCQFARAAIPLVGIPSGEYHVRAVVGSGTGPLGSIGRRFRRTAPSS
jgi:VWFA-related protein